MCGIAGYFDRRGIELARGREVAGRMADAIAHRGPDDHGAWADAAGVAFGHRRLSILDLSPLGHQPMQSASGRYTVVFNGEIYNFEALRNDLERRGCRFRGRSDTEVLLAACEEHGVSNTLPKLRGMFAFAMWDASDRRLHLARDRIGEKPLYYGWIDGGRVLVFGSELKALRAHPAFDARISRRALTSFMRYGYVPAPSSIYDGICKLPAGSWVSFGMSPPDPPTSTYYSLVDVAERGVASARAISLDEAADRLDVALHRAVREQMVADVPVGAFLSGGLDSSTVVAVMQAESTRPVRTFSIGFREKTYDEAPFAKRIAAHLGTDHVEVYVTPAEALAVIPELPRIYDEPFADSSQIPTVLVSRIARSQVTVSLSGDGGDELLGGYPRYELLRRLARLMSLPGRRLAAAGVHRLLGMLDDRTGQPSRFQRRIDWARRLTALASARDAAEIHALLMSFSFDAGRIVLGGAEDRGVFPLSPDILSAGNITERAMLADALQYLPDDILVKVDRAAMSTSLETRVPMLDPGFVEAAWSLPYDAKVRAPQAKVALGHLLARYVPRELFERPKKGFAVPVSAWLRGPLFDWAVALLDEKRVRDEGYLDAALVRRRWEIHLAGIGDWSSTLWNILMWQAWYESVERGT
jgi:asparagine synthase (glutamine-hydrolysing)